MNRRLGWFVLWAAALLADCGLAGERAESAFAPRGSIAAQRSGWQGWGRRLRDLWRRESPYLKNDASVKAAYREATEEAAKATVEVLAGDKVVALGAVVDSQGYIVTKASLLEGQITCRIAGHPAWEASLVGVSLEHDLALLKVDAHDLPVVVWRTESAPPGTLVAAVAPDGDAIGLGVVSAEARRVPGPRRQGRQPGWLGVSLGGGDAGTRITEVVEGAPAAEAGLQAGDVVASIDGRPMRSMDEVIETVGSHEPGHKLVVVVERREESLTREVVLGRRPPGATPEDEWGGGPFSVRREGFPNVLPHDVALLPSQCGGPLIDMDGKAIGINIARALRVTTYAIPAETVQQVVASLRG